MFLDILPVNFLELRLNSFLPKQPKLGDRLMAGRQTLTLSIKVRILVPQPEIKRPGAGRVFLFLPIYHLQFTVLLFGPFYGKW